jgi:hypothetical protein
VTFGWECVSSNINSIEHSAVQSYNKSLISLIRAKNDWNEAVQFHCEFFQGRTITFVAPISPGGWSEFEN